MFSKRILRLLMVSAAVAPLAGQSASAQMYPGEDVIVNPAAIPRSPGPDQSYPRIVLKRPSRQRHHSSVAKSTTPVEAPTASAEVPNPPVTAENNPAPPAKPKKQAHATEATSATNPSGGAVPFSLSGEDEPLGAPQTKVAKSEPPPQQTQKPEKSDDLQPGLAKRGAILFEHNATDPQPAQLDGIRLLATDLSSALEAGATQIQLEAFGGAPGDKSSDARRISLKRALAIRQLLIDNGVPASRIVTRAMGGITDKGTPDRVDIYVRSS